MSLPPLFATDRLQGPVHTSSHLYQTVIACSPFTLPPIRLGSIISQKLHNPPFSFRRVQLQYKTRTIHVSGCHISALGGPHVILTLKFTPEFSLQDCPAARQCWRPVQLSRLSDQAMVCMTEKQGFSFRQDKEISIVSKKSIQTAPQPTSYPICVRSFSLGYNCR